MTAATASSPSNSASSPRNSLRERKKARTRERIVRVATRLFLEHGFEETTVGEIAAAADISQRTFFRYFPTKEALVFRDHDDRVAGFRASLAACRTPRAPYEGVRRALTAFAADYERNQEELLAEWRIVTASPLLIARDVELDLEYEAAIAASIAGAGDPAAPIDSHVGRLAAGAIFGTIRATMQAWFSAGCQTSLVAMGEQALSLLASGLGTLGAAGSAADRAAGSAPERAR